MLKNQLSAWCLCNFVLKAIERRGGLARTGELVQDGVRPSALLALWRQGRLLRLKAGLYQLPEMLAEEHAAVIQAVRAVPEGVICLLTALDIYGPADATPEQIFVALPQGNWSPLVAEPPLRIVRYRQRLFLLGREEIVLSGQRIPLYSREKTLCDCFRLPNIVGLDHALAALRRYLREPTAEVGAWLAMAAQCRVLKRLRLYTKAIVS